MGLGGSVGGVCMFLFLNETDRAKRDERRMEWKDRRKSSSERINRDNAGSKSADDCIVLHAMLADIL